MINAAELRPLKLLFFIRAVRSTQAISKNHISRCCMMMRCVEILRSIDGFTSCTAVQPHGTAVQVIRLHSSRTNFVFCEPPIQVYDFFCSIFRPTESKDILPHDCLGAQWYLVVLLSGCKLTCNPWKVELTSAVHAFV